MRHRVMATGLVALLACAVVGNAQDKRRSLEELTRYREMRSGKRPLQESSAADTDLNKAAIKKVAQWHVSRLMYAASKSLGSSDELPIHQAVKEFAADVLEINPNNRLNTGQQDFIKAFGQETMAALAPVLNFKPPYGADKTLLLINTGRCVSALAKSGYEPLADNCVAIIDNPAVGDAIRLYFLQALKNLFATPNQEQ